MTSTTLSTLPSLAEPAEDSFDAPLASRDFDSLEEAEDYLRDFGVSKGFAIARKDSQFNRAMPKVWIKCVAGGKARNTRGILPEKRLRQRTSRRSNCPFKATIGQISISPPKWELIVHESNHNHGRSLPGSVHHTLRRFNQAEKDHIHSQIWFRVSPKSILEALKKRNPTIAATPRDVSNELSRAKLAAWGGIPPLEALLDWLRRHSAHWVASWQAEDDTGELCGLVFLNQGMKDAAKRWGTVLALDCTYSVNQNAMPLLQVCGVTCTGHTYVAGYALLKGEKEEDYAWALEALTAVGEWEQPKVAITDRDKALMNALADTWSNTELLLCRWHTNKAIQAHIKKIHAPLSRREGAKAGDKATADFMEMWSEVFNAQSKADMDRAWGNLHRVYGDQPLGKQALKYLKKDWWPWSDRFITCHINQWPHYDLRTTSRVESAHAALKKGLTNRQADLGNLIARIAAHVHGMQLTYTLAVQHNYEHANVELSRVPLFEGVVRHVSNYALRKLRTQYAAVKAKLAKPDGDCNCDWNTYMGMPCRHRLAAWLARRRRCVTADFDKHWLLQPEKEARKGWFPPTRPDRSITGRIQRAPTHPPDDFGLDELYDLFGEEVTPPPVNLPEDLQSPVPIARPHTPPIAAAPSLVVDSPERLVVPDTNVEVNRPMPVVRAPRKKRPSGSANTRIPSQHESIQRELFSQGLTETELDGSQVSTGLRHCRGCGEAGHDSGNCRRRAAINGGGSSQTPWPSLPPLTSSGLANRFPANPTPSLDLNTTLSQGYCTPSQFNQASQEPGNALSGLGTYGGWDPSQASVGPSGHLQPPQASYQSFF